MNCPNCGHLLQGETPPALDAGKTKLAITMLERFRDGRLMTAQDTHESLLGPRDQLLQEADWFDHAANVLKRSLPLQQETGVSHMTSDETRTALGAETPVPVANLAEGEALFRQRHQSSMSDEQIKHMVNRFLGWRLPHNFRPDAGISFKAEYNEHTAHPAKHEPIGTNLFDAEQAEAMIRYMLVGLPLKAEPSQEYCEHGYRPTFCPKCPQSDVNAQNG